MGFSLKGLFKKKPGGTGVGNAIRGIVKGASTVASIAGTFLPIPGIVTKAAGLVSNLMPDAPESVQSLATDGIAQAAAQPAASFDLAKSVASVLKMDLLSAGATEQQASAAGAAAYSATTAPPTVAVRFLDNMAETVPAGGASFLSKEDVKVIANGALEGAKNGAVDKYLDETQSGRETKAAAVDAQGQKAMPFILAALLLFIFFNRK